MKSKQPKRLWSLALLLMLMCLPQMAWAETGVWTYKGTHYGICAVNKNTSIQYNGMGNNSGWGDNSILYREDLGWGSKGTEFGGKTTKEDEKFTSNPQLSSITPILRDSCPLFAEFADN